jgi:dihydropteroate synthase
MIPAEGLPQVLVFRDLTEARTALERVRFSAAGIRLMVMRSVFRVVRLSGLGIREVNILKQELRSRGGDAAISEELFAWMREDGDCLLMGTLAQFERLLPRLKAPELGMRKLACSIEAALRNNENPLPACPPGLDLTDGPVLMGILNVTPDSFSDGGAHGDLEATIRAGLDMAAEGAAFVDVGGESTRPGADPVPWLEELGRVQPVVKALAVELPGRISIDTYKAPVAAGAYMVTDISALRMDAGMLAVVRDAACPVILMHMLGEPRNMQSNPVYGDVVEDLYAFFVERLNWAVDQGLKEENLLIDPGLGFGKTTAHNLEILRNLAAFRSLGRPIVVGASRKRFLGEILGIDEPKERDVATALATTMAALAGAHVVRVHNVGPNRDAVGLARAVAGARAPIGRIRLQSIEGS